MHNRTQILCMHEGLRGHSVDPVFINRLIRSLKPDWIRPWEGNNVVRLLGSGGRSELIATMPDELQACLEAGSSTTLMVWADLDHDMPDGDALREVFWAEAKRRGISREDFDGVVFAFAKDRLENWIEFLNTGSTDESQEGPRVGKPKEVAQAARRLANACLGRERLTLPPSLQWSCVNWHALKKRMGA